MRGLWLLLLTLLAPLFGYANTLAEPGIFASNGIDAKSAEIINRHVLTITQLTTVDDSFKGLNVKGIFATVAKEGGKEAVALLRSKLANGLRVYLYDNNYGYDDDLIAIGHFANDLEYLAVAKPSGVNWDIQPSDVMNKYKGWSEKYQLKLVGAGLDWLEAEVESDNVDWQQLAEEVYQFCPDVVEQGSGDVKQLAAEMKAAKVLFLWWD